MINMKKLFVLLAIAVLVASVVVARNLGPDKKLRPMAPDSIQDVRRAIEKGNAQWSEGWARGDAAMVASIFAEDGVQLAGSGKIFKGTQQILERQKVAMQEADPGVKVTVTTVQVWLDGDSAYETGKYKYEYTEKGKPGVDEGRYVTIWKRQKDGSWKLAMDLGVPHD